MGYYQRIKNMLNELNAGLSEREEAMRLILLGFFAGKSVFLYGPPGTAKSMIARKAADFYKADSSEESHTKFFPYLMNRFSTPEEIFGPIDIQALKQNRLKRNIKGYLPDAEFAFLDEIWKSSPAILNTLLTIINEKIYRDGSEDKSVPLRGLVCASNEFPTPNQGLEALYDRMVLRYEVLPIQRPENFKNLVCGGMESAKVSEPFSKNELDDIAKKSKSVKFSDAAFGALEFLKRLVEEYNKTIAETQESAADDKDEKDEKDGADNANLTADSTTDSNIDSTKAVPGIYVSDRKWRQMAELLKTAAFLSDRDEVLPADLAILKHCLWSEQENKNQAEQMVYIAINSALGGDNGRLYELKKDYEKQKALIKQNFYNNDGTPKKTAGLDEMFLKSIAESRSEVEKEKQKAIETAQKMDERVKNPFISDEDLRASNRNAHGYVDALGALLVAYDELVSVIKNLPKNPFGESADSAKKQKEQSDEDRFVELASKQGISKEVAKKIYNTKIDVSQLSNSTNSNSSQQLFGAFGAAFGGKSGGEVGRELGRIFDQVSGGSNFSSKNNVSSLVGKHVSSILNDVSANDIRAILKNDELRKMLIEKNKK